MGLSVHNMVIDPQSCGGRSEYWLIDEIFKIFTFDQLPGSSSTAGMRLDEWQEDRGSGWQRNCFKLLHFALAMNWVEFWGLFNFCFLSGKRWQAGKVGPEGAFKGRQHHFQFSTNSKPHQPAPATKVGAPGPKWRHCPTQRPTLATYFSLALCNNCTFCPR